MKPFFPHIIMSFLGWIWFFWVFKDWIFQYDTSFLNIVFIVIKFNNEMFHINRFYSTSVQWVVWERKMMKSFMIPEFWNDCSFLFIVCEYQIRSDQISHSCPTLCDPMNRSTPGLPVHHQLPEFTQEGFINHSFLNADLSLLSLLTGKTTYQPIWCIYKLFCHIYTFAMEWTKWSKNELYLLSSYVLVCLFMLNS